MDLEITQREYRVGRFSLDVLAKDLNSNRIVAIENQLEETDHKHLGQLITYAAGVDASVLVWIARDFCEEHRQALDWLNHGEGSTEFFGIIVELLRIDESKPAVHFRVVASHNYWSRAKKASVGFRGASSDRSEKYRKFFQGLIDELREKYSFTNARAAQAQNWFSFASGVSYITYAAVFTGRSQIRAEVYIDAGPYEQNMSILDFLRERVGNEPAAVDEPLAWEVLEGRRATRVAFYRSGAITNATDEDISEYQAWFVDRLFQLKKIFGPHLASAAAQSFAE